MHSSREGFTVRVLRAGSAAPAGIGFVVGDRHIVTCAHVVNTAVGRDQRSQDKLGPEMRIQVDFPMLGDADDAPLRSCRVEAWDPPPLSGLSGGDVAGLVLVGEGLPHGAGSARLTDPGLPRNVAVDVFGCPPRRQKGAWALLRLRSAVTGGLLQLDADSESAIYAQPGYSGSPAVISDDAGDLVTGMLAVASRDEGIRDAYAIPVSRLVAAPAWPEVLADWAIPPCPYRALDAFTGADGDKGLFVGREEEIVQLREMADQHALIVVTGPSGVGKSSLVAGGLMPALQREGWITASFRPGRMPYTAMPLEALARALLEVEQSDRVPGLNDLAQMASELRSEGLSSVGSRLSLLKGKPIALAVDQLEEILDPDACPAGVRAEFLELLLFHQAASGGLRLIGTLRADFLSQLLGHPDAGTRLQGRLLSLSPLGRERLVRVIQEPARTCGVEYEEGLAKQIAREASSGGGLPLLEFALTELWPRQQKRRITFTAYHQSGGVIEVLSRHAEQVFAHLAGQFTEERIRRVLLTLVRSRGGAAGATRRVVSREHLGANWPIAEQLAERRLLVLGHGSAGAKETVELAHEALVQAWPRLASWGRRGCRLPALANQHGRTGKRKRYLVRGAHRRG